MPTYCRHHDKSPNEHQLNWPSSSSYSVYGRTPLWCLHKLAAAGGIRKTCACPRAACEWGSTCESSLSAGTQQTGDLQQKQKCCRRTGSGGQDCEILRGGHRKHKMRGKWTKRKTRVTGVITWVWQKKQHTTKSTNWISAKKDKTY